MRRTPCVLLALLSLFGLADGASAQAPQDRPSSQQESGFVLEQNYPNPFNPETRIPFVLNEGLFVEGEPVVVSVRIFNVLQQFVAAPTALGYPGGADLPLLQLEFSNPGSYEAFWDGRDRNGNQVASGIYLVQLTVNGRTAVRKMFVTK